MMTNVFKPLRFFQLLQKKNLLSDIQPGNSEGAFAFYSTSRVARDSLFNQSPLKGDLRARSGGEVVLEASVVSPFCMKSSLQKQQVCRSPQAEVKAGETFL